MSKFVVLIAVLFYFASLAQEAKSSMIVDSEEAIEALEALEEIEGNMELKKFSFKPFICKFIPKLCNSTSTSSNTVTTGTVLCDFRTGAPCAATPPTGTCSADCLACATTCRPPAADLTQMCPAGAPTTCGPSCCKR